MYDVTGSGVPLRDYTSVSLAWWHSYKWTAMMIMKVFGPDIIGPMFHHLFPGREYSVHKMQHTAKITYISYIRLAYPKFKATLDSARMRIDLPQKQKTLLANISELCEFFIPAVSGLSFFLTLYSYNNIVHNKFICDFCCFKNGLYIL
jgi:hypothetical protein